MHEAEPAGTVQGTALETEIITLCVRWYLQFGLGFRSLEELMAERNVSVDHVTIWRWVQRYPRNYANTAGRNCG
jgi:IS6 family transposase